MHALVVYESMFGNTRELARTVAVELQGLLGPPCQDVEVGVAADRIPDDVGLLVVGAPTHTFGLSSEGTRRDASRRAGTDLVSAGTGVREWLDRLEPVSGRAVLAAAFDTRTLRPRMPSRAGSSIRRRLHRLGFEPSPASAWFGVEGMTGPVPQAELDRAREWARGLAAAAQRPAGADHGSR